MLEAIAAMVVILGIGILMAHALDGNTGIMSNDIEDRTARYRNELAQCDRDDRSAENAEMCRRGWQRGLQSGPVGAARGLDQALSDR